MQKPEKVNLDRSLPPTPISESPQVSPIAVIDPDELDGRSATAEFLCKSERTMDHVVPSPIHLNDWQRRFAHLSYASMDMEIVIPPDLLPGVDIIEPLNIVKRNKDGRGDNFF